MADGVGGFRFKPDIGYSHPEYWDAVYVPVTEQQEHAMWYLACDMADVNPEELWSHLTIEPNQHISEERTHGDCIYGPNNVKYDKAGAAFSYWTKFDWWKPSKKNMVCCRAVTDVVLAGMPEAMDTIFVDGVSTRQACYASMTPSEVDGMMRNYFSAENIIGRVTL
jgi:hypothetical protein